MICNVSCVEVAKWVIEGNVKSFFRLATLQGPINLMGAWGLFVRWLFIYSTENTIFLKSGEGFRPVI